jgi:tetratricopeptide (TPR) repeat protein
MNQTHRTAEAEAVIEEIPVLLQKLAQRFPQALQFRRYFASDATRRAAQLRAIGQPDVADQKLRESIDRWRAVVAEFATVPDFRRELAEAYLTRGMTLSLSGKYDDAVAVLFEGVKLDSKLAADFPNFLAYRTEYAKGCDMMAVTLRGKGDDQAAFDWFGRAIVLLEGNLKAVPNRKSDRERLVTALKERGLSANRLQKFQDYDRDWERSTELAEGLDAYSVRVARAARNISEGHSDKAFAEAEYLLRYEDLSGGEWIDLAAVLAACASVAPDDAGKEARAKMALEALANAAAERYSDQARLVDDRRFDILRRRPEFIQLAGAEKKSQ